MEVGMGRRLHQTRSKQFSLMQYDEKRKNKKNRFYLAYFSGLDEDFTKQIPGKYYYSPYA